MHLQIIKINHLINYKYQAQSYGEQNYLLVNMFRLKDSLHERDSYRWEFIKLSLTFDRTESDGYTTGHGV
jgi:hypothetical protein